MNNETIIILDSGKWDIFKIASMVRAENVYCEILPCDAAIVKIVKTNPKGIICSKDFLPNYKIISELGIPILEMRDIVKSTDESVDITINMDLLRDFLINICGCKCDWTIRDFIKQKTDEIRSKTAEKKALMAFSGGVDSSVAAVLMNKVMGNRLVCIFVDNGLLRKNEADYVEKVFRDKFNLELIRVDAKKQFLQSLKGITDPEQKRKIIGEQFIRVFEKEAKKIGKVDFLVQGTIYPDIIESFGAKGNLAIKSHHNVGGLPEHIDFEEIIEPLKNLFKNEVRAVGEELQLPKEIVWRQPFPGPGLAIRVMGEVTEEKLEILRDADEIFRQEILKAGLEYDIWQYFAVLTDMKSVGVSRGERTYDYTVALRAVNSINAMTGDWARIPYEVLETVSKRIVSEVQSVNRVVYDITAKPPATIEWE